MKKKMTYVVSYQRDIFQETKYKTSQYPQNKQTGPLYIIEEVRCTSDKRNRVLFSQTSSESKIQPPKLEKNHANQNHYTSKATNLRTISFYITVGKIKGQGTQKCVRNQDEKQLATPAVRS